MKICYWLGDDGGNEGNWAIAANWSTGTIPVDGDVVIFNGDNLTDVSAGTDQTGVNLASMRIEEGFTGAIGDNDKAGAGVGPLIIACSGIIKIEGTGAVYLQSGNDVNDCIISHVIFNSSGSLHLSSQKNALAGNVSKFTTIQVIQGTLTLLGFGDITNSGAQSGTAFDTLLMTPTSASFSDPNIEIRDLCTDLKNVTSGTVVMFVGTLTTMSELAELEQYAGVVHLPYIG